MKTILASYFSINNFSNSNCLSISLLCSPNCGAPFLEINNLLSTLIGHHVVVPASPLLVFTTISIFKILYPSSLISSS